MIVYLIKMTVCALLLYAVYALLLEREKMHRFKRVYLLGSLVFSLMVPFTTLTINVPQIPENFQRHAELVSASPWFQEIAGDPESSSGRNEATPIVVESATQAEETVESASSINYSLLIIGVYVLITSLFMFRLLKNSWQMLARGRKNASMDYHEAKIALINEKTVPHSFGRYIFINREDYNNGRVADEIIRHEWAHVSQRHTWDIVFIELLIAFGCFNPVFYLYRSKIRQNHEFLADEAVVGDNSEYVPAYQTILMNFISKNKNINFISSFNLNFLFTKKRIVMMTKTTSKKRAWCMSLALIPVFIVAICVFSTCDMKQNGKENPMMDDAQMITPGMGVSQELLTEYQTIVNKYLENHTTGESEKWYWNTNFLSEEDWSRLYVIYVQMTYDQQKEQSITFYGGPAGALGRSYPPNQRQFNMWKDDKKCHIWMDGEKVEDKSVLDSLATTDFDEYFVSSFSRVKNRYEAREARIDLWTKTGYEKLRLHFRSQPLSIRDLLEIEPDISFLVEKDKEKTVYLSRNPQFGWKSRIVENELFVTENGDKVIRSWSRSPAPTPLLYHQEHQWIYSDLCNCCN